MKRESIILSIVSAFSMFAWVACGGSTMDVLVPGGSDADSGVDGGTSGATAGSTGSTTSGGNTTSGGGSTIGGGGGAAGSGFDPGGIGTIIGSVPDGGTWDGGRATIRPEVVDGCNALCAKEATANCPNQGTIASCVVGCRLFLNNPKCATQTSALFACQGRSDVGCDDQGKATLVSCPAEQVRAAGCFLDNAVDPSLNGPCATYCAGVAGAMCPNDDGSCRSSCPIVGNLIPACNEGWRAYVTCASNEKFTCGNDGKAGAQACGLEFARFALCLASGVLDTGDAGR
jgi:hypothetical protein